MLAIALALRLANSMPDLVSGVLFGIALGCIIVLSATRRRHPLSR